MRAILIFVYHRARHDALRHDSHHKYPTRMCQDLGWSGSACSARANASASDRAVHLALLAQCAPKRGSGREAVEGSVTSETHSQSKGWNGRWSVVKNSESRAAFFSV